MVRLFLCVTSVRSQMVFEWGKFIVSFLLRIWSFDREIQLGEGLALLWVHIFKSFLANLKALENSECVHRHVHMHKVFESL